MTHVVRIEHHHNLFIDDEQLPVHLTRKEALLLDMFMRATAVVTADMFLNQAYNGIDEPLHKIFSVFVCKLRAKLGVHRVLIETVWGRGFKRNMDYSYNTSAVACMSIDVPLEYLDHICFVNGKDAKTSVIDLVRKEYKRLQEM